MYKREIALVEDEELVMVVGMGVCENGRLESAWLNKIRPELATVSAW